MTVAADRLDYSHYTGPLSRVYDLVYTSRGKDFAAEAQEIADVIRARRPGAASLLDVDCGTGEHLVTWRHLFAEVEGVDISADMRAVARAKLPGVPIHDGACAISPWAGPSTPSAHCSAPWAT
ncbi:methyltransferase domain-containing protein [Micromonospora sp. HNM0581]|uniref:class I SAM-dependent methyltransferase n=1 Tax=Micromonospora sp. HNM0581 TaxID=2716341 RepID=UPI00197C78CF|nr:methyltransferase domain-containing protein [Micromonospora sp. HNM0581]